MSNVAISFASLVKSNNGMFKSEAQAKFLLSQCQEENVFHTGGNVYKNSYMLSYYCDAQGVVKVEKYLPKTSKVEITWKRLTNEQFQAKQAKEVETKEREARLQESAMAKFQARLDAFQKALDTAKAYVKETLMNGGVSESMAQRIVDSTMKDQDSISKNLDFLSNCEEFVKAWEAYNNEPGV